MWIVPVIGPLLLETAHRSPSVFLGSVSMGHSLAVWAAAACFLVACSAPLAAADRWANPPLTDTCDHNLDGILDQFYGENSTAPASCDADCRAQCNEVLHFTFTLMSTQRCFTEDRLRECLLVGPPAFCSLRLCA